MRIFSLAATLLLGASLTSADELRTLQEGSFKGEVKSVTKEKIVFNDNQEGELSFSVKEVLYLKVGTGKSITGVQYHDIELRDGTLLHCSSYEIKGEQAKLSLISGQELKLPLTAITSLLHEANNPINRKEWKERVLKKKGVRDILAIKRDGVVNRLQGTLGKASDDGKSIEFSLSRTTKANVAFSRVFGLYWIRAPDAAWNPIICKVLDSHTNLVLAHNVELTKTGYLVETPAGARLEYKKEDIVNLDYSRGKLVFLPDLPPVSEEYDKPKSTSETPKIRFDMRDSRGLVPLRLDGRFFNRGMLVHANTEIEYDLEGEYRELKAIVGVSALDVAGLANGPVQFRILCDGKEVKSITFDQKNAKRAQSIVIPVKDVQRLKLIVSTVKSEDPNDLFSEFNEGKMITLGDIRVLK